VLENGKPNISNANRRS